jgi:hypothetical protein
MATPPVKYANDEVVAKIVAKQISDQSKLNTIISEQKPSIDKYNGLFPIPTNIQNLIAAELKVEEDKYKDTYTFGAFRFIPDSEISANSANFACIVPPEDAKENTTNMKKIDNGAYHTFATCSNKAALNNNKYFSIVKPSTETGVTDPNLYECWVGDDPLMKNPNDQTSYYKYITIWDLGGGITGFEIEKTAGDIIITADDTKNLGISKQQYSDTTTNYTYVQGSYLPPNMFANMETSIFDINQVNIISANINGGIVGKNVPISQINYVNGSNKQVIVSAKDGPYLRMIKLEIAMGDGITAGLPYNKSLYIKALEAKYSSNINGGANRFVRVTAGCGNESWLQISQIQVFDNNGVNVALGKPVSDYPTSGPYRTNPRLVVDGTAAPRRYPNVYLSGSACNATLTIDLQIDTPISKIVVYNRGDCCNNRLLGATLECLSVDGAQLYKSSMTGDMIQTFTIPKNNTFDINALWEKSTVTPLVSNGTDNGMGINTLVVRVTPDAVAKGVTGYSTKNDSKLALSQTSYKTLEDTTKEQCRIACDNDADCYGYSTNGAKDSKNETGLTDLGCYKDTWTRALMYYNGNGQNRDSCLAAAKRNQHKYFGLQYYGQCFSSNDDSVATGYARYGADTRPCATLGIDWQNHVYRRDFSPTETTICNLYGKAMDGATTAQQNSTVAQATITKLQVNNSTLNLTNNEMKKGRGICNESCNAYLELGNDGNLKIYKPPNNSTVPASSTSSGEVLWDLFETYPDTKKTIQSIAPIGESSWKRFAAQSPLSNTLQKGESLTADQTRSTSSSKPYLISKNGQFMLQIVGGHIKLKAAVYGCFSADSTYNSIDRMYTKLTSGPQSFYVYQSNLADPKVGNTYHYANKTADKNNPSERQLGLRKITGNKIVKNTNEFQDISRMNYMPLNDISPNSINANEDECKKACIATENCNYVYTKNGVCKLGNSVLPAFVPNPSNTDKYNLFLRNKKLDTEMIKTQSIFSEENLTEKVQDAGILFGNKIIGSDIESVAEGEFSSCGYLANPLGRAIHQQSKVIAGENVDIKRKGNPPAGAPRPLDQYGEPPAPVNYNQTTIIGGATSTLQQGFSNREGFDSHGWKAPGVNCGTAGKDQCYPGILYGQIKPLQEISNDYSAKLNRINSNYLDISNNISKYKDVYNVVSNDAKYDFSGDQDIVLDGPTDLLTEMKNDSKQLALQTNNMYIAGSILTTTLLISAIYLGRS